MKINEHTALSTSKVLLVPYSTHHVPTYHEWMQDRDLQLATASEPLTLEEEYNMQRSWRKDPDKLTFIICLASSSIFDNEKSETSTKPSEHDSSHRMIGDINLFLFDEDSVDETGVTGEIELMIARKDLQRHGYGRAALLAFMDYVLSQWESIAAEYRDVVKSSARLAYLRVKINQTNERSIQLFRSIGFEQVGEGANYFDEVELRWRHDVDYLRHMKWYEEPRLLWYE